MAKEYLRVANIDMHPEIDTVRSVFKRGFSCGYRTVDPSEGSERSLSFRLGDLIVATQELEPCIVAVNSCKVFVDATPQILAFVVLCFSLRSGSCMHMVGGKDRKTLINNALFMHPVHKMDVLHARTPTRNVKWIENGAQVT